MNHLEIVRTTPLPPMMRGMKRDERGYPIPFFASISKTGVADFRVMSVAHRAAAIEQSLCGICGKWLAGEKCILGGPGILEYRTSFDIPMHEECARYALIVCPFLAMPSFGYKDFVEGENGVYSAIPGSSPPPKPERMGLFFSRVYRMIRNPQTHVLYFEFAPWSRIEWLPDTTSRVALGPERTHLLASAPMLSRVASAPMCRFEPGSTVDKVELYEKSEDGTEILHETLYADREDKGIITVSEKVLADGMQRLEHLRSEKRQVDFPEVPGVKAKHVFITDQCRANRGDRKAIEEALRRIKGEAVMLLQGYAPDQGAEFHIVLTVARTKGGSDAD